MDKKHHAYTQLGIAMLRAGVLGFGGGPSVIPLFRYEAVTRYNWLSDDEFAEVLAIANALPGPIATKMAAYLGYQQKKTLGAAVAICSHILPSSLAMIALLSFVQILAGSRIVAGMIAAVTPVIAVMLGTMAYEFAEKAVEGLGKKIGAALFLFSFLLLQVIGMHPAVVILLFLAYGTIHFRFVAKLKANRKREAQ